MPDRIAIATALVDHCEGCSLTPYRDLHGYWTIGAGSRFLESGMPVTALTRPRTMDEALALRDGQLAVLAPAVAALIEPALSEPEQGALLSLVYNIGIGAFAKSSMLHFLNLHAWDLAVGQFDRWSFVRGVRINGLRARRALERGVYLGLVDPMTLLPVTVPTTPHPAFTDTGTTGTSTEDLNAQELSLLRGSTTPALEAAPS